MENTEFAAIEEQPEGKRRIQHPWVFAAGILCLVLFAAYGAYDWLIITDAIMGPQLRTYHAFVILGTALVGFTIENYKCRWTKIGMLVFMLAAAVLFAIGLADIFRPFPERTQFILDFEILSAAFTILICIFYMIIALVYPQPSEKRRLSRKEKIKVAIVIISIAAGLALWFGGRELLYWLLTR